MKIKKATFETAQTITTLASQRNSQQSGSRCMPFIFWNQRESHLSAPPEELQRIDRAFANIPEQDERIKLFMTLLQLWYERDRHPRIAKAVFGKDTFSHADMFRLMGTLTKDGREFRLWFGLPLLHTDWEYTTVDSRGDNSDSEDPDPGDHFDNYFGNGLLVSIESTRSPESLEPYLDLLCHEERALKSTCGAKIFFPLALKYP